MFSSAVFGLNLRTLTTAARTRRRRRRGRRRVPLMSLFCSNCSTSPGTACRSSLSPVLGICFAYFFVVFFLLFFHYQQGRQHEGWLQQWRGHRASPSSPFRSGSICLSWGCTAAPRTKRLPGKEFQMIPRLWHLCSSTYHLTKQH